MDEIKRAMLEDQEAAKRLTDAGVLLMQGDCLELLKDIPDGSVDMVLTDPPYGKKSDKGTNGYGVAKTRRYTSEWDKKMILSRLVDTFISRISLTMLPVPKPHNTACVLSWEEARRWQSRSSGYSSS